MTDIPLLFHRGEAPRHLGLGDTRDPGAGWFEWPGAPRPADAGLPPAVRAAVAGALAG